jgi:hypothetical protein
MRRLRVPHHQQRKVIKKKERGLIMNATEAQKLIDQIGEIMENQNELMNNILRAAQQMRENSVNLATIARSPLWSVARPNRVEVEAAKELA